MILLAALARAGGEVRGETVDRGPLRERLAAEPADLVVLYAGEQKGSMEPCGCAALPRGSLARLGSVVAAVDGSPEVLVNAGHWLDDPFDFQDRVRPPVALGNAWTARGLARLPWDAVNVGEIDLVALPTVDPGTLPLVSASFEGPGILPYRVVERGGLRVGLTGISGEVPRMGRIPPGYRRRGEAEERRVLAALAQVADVVVLLAWHAPERARALAALDVDVVVDADGHREHRPPRVERRDTVWVTSALQTWWVGELRMRVEAGRVTSAVDRQIDLDPEVPEDRELRRLQQEALDALRRLED